MAPSPDLRGLPFERKLESRHWERLAVVYVRQSTMHQVQQHQESTQLQYGLVDRAMRLGWSRPRILVIDDDLGLSAASAEKRAGFQRLLAEVALDRVGIILGVEMSRLARSCKDWYQLLELCALFGTLICDLDGLYDPSCYNDRLLLGLKGTMSEAELHILQQRMQQGAMQKARRGELVTKVPIGYVRTAAGEVSLDPDAQAQSVVRLIFEQFERIGTVAGVLRWMVQQDILLPVRVDSGPQQGQLEWRRPGDTTLRNLLTHPMYAGAYVYGRRTWSRQPGTVRQRHQHLSRERWQVLIRDHYPAYLSWDEYERNVARIAENRSCCQARGPVRQGRALLAGLVVCGRCGLRMTTRYAGKSSQPRYSCERARAQYAAPNCQSLAARVVDDEVVRLLLMAMTPAALDVSLQVAADVEQQFAQSEQQWQQKLERARYETDRARRQFAAVEPENRLVARTLETAWEHKLRAERDLVERHEDFLRQQPRLLTALEQAEIRRLAADLPHLWNAPSTCDADRKEVLRQVIEQVRVEVEGDTEWVDVRIDWVGGHQTQTRLRRPVARLEQLSTWSTIRQRICEMKSAGVTVARMAIQLNREGFRNPDGHNFSEEQVRTWLSRYGWTEPRSSSLELEADEWLIPDLARHLAIPYRTIYTWIEDGHLRSRRLGNRRVVSIGPEQLAELTSRARHSSLRKAPDDHTSPPPKL